MKARPAALAAALAAVLVLSLSACGSDQDKGSRTEPGQELTAVPQAESTQTPAADAKTIAIKLAGETVSPAGTEVDVKTGQDVVLTIDSDKTGELHVHSTPEKHVEFPAGQSTITLSFDKPGVIAIEDHALDKLIVQLKVS